MYLVYPCPIIPIITRPSFLACRTIMCFRLVPSERKKLIVYRAKIVMIVSTRLYGYCQHMFPTFRHLPLQLPDDPFSPCSMGRSSYISQIFLGKKVKAFLSFFCQDRPVATIISLVQQAQLRLIPFIQEQILKVFIEIESQPIAMAIFLARRTGVHPFGIPLRIQSILAGYLYRLLGTCPNAIGHALP